MTKLYRKQGCESVFLQIGHKEYELDFIIFYNNDGEIFGNRLLNLEDKFELDFEFKIKKRVECDFKEKLACIVKTVDYDNLYDLYIHEDLIGLKLSKYKLEMNQVYALYETNIPRFNFKVKEKCIDKNLINIKNEIVEESKKLTKYNRITSESLQEGIDKLSALKEKLEKEEEKISKYTIEDYIKEINE